MRGDDDAVERDAVVDDARAGLGEAPRRHDVVGARAWRRRAAEHDGAERGGVAEPLQGGGDERDERRAAVRGRQDGGGVEARLDLEGGAREQRAGHDGEPADVRAGQAAQPSIRAGVDAEARRGGRRAGRDRVVGEDDRAGRGRRARGRHDERVAGLDPAAVGAADLALVGDAPRRRQRVELGRARGSAESGVQHARRVAVRPDPLEERAERGTLDDVDRDELGHGRTLRREHAGLAGRGAADRRERAAPSSQAATPHVAALELLDGPPGERARHGRTEPARRSRRRRRSASLATSERAARSASTASWSRPSRRSRSARTAKR